MTKGYWRKTYVYYDIDQVQRVLKSQKREGIKIKMTKAWAYLKGKKVRIYTLWRWRIKIGS